MYPGRDYVLVGLMLFLPLFDRHWRLPAIPRRVSHYIAWTVAMVVFVGLILWRPQYSGYAVSTLLLAALPEEWFFRAYFMEELGNGWRANLITSVLFSVLHGLARDWLTGLLVALPSLFYGWLYQRTRDLPLLVLLHGLSNLVFMLFLQRTVMIFLGSLL
ncbi:MAG: CPBP family glutamic-type intramembrane protease [Sulfuricaulis sp.]